MSIALITTSTKMRNGVYCCVIHEAKYIVDILCTCSSQQGNKFIFEKKIFQTYTTAAIFHFFEELFHYYECKLPNIYKRRVLLYFYDKTRSNHRRCSKKKLSLKISQYSQENTCVGVSF